MSVTTPETAPTSTPPPGTGAAPLPPLSDDVRAFCERHGLLPHLPTVFRLLREEFSPVGEIELSVRENPDAEDYRLILNVPVSAPVPEVLESHRRFLERWVPLTTNAVRMRTVVIWTLRP